MINIAALTPFQKKLAIALMGILLLYLVFGFLGAPFIVRSILEKKVAAALHRDIRVASVRVNPVTLSLTLKHFEVNKNNGEPFARMARLFVNLQAWSVIKGGLVLRDVEIEGLRADIKQYKDGSFNFSDMAGSRAPDTEKGKQENKPFFFSVFNTRIKGANVSYSDNMRSVNHIVDSLNATLIDLTSFPKESGVYTLFNVDGNLNGARISLKGKGRPFHETLSARAELDVRNASLPLYLPYVTLPDNMTLLSTVFNTASEIAFTRKKGNPGSCIISGNTHFTDTRIGNKKGEALFTFPHITIQTGKSDIIAGQVHIESIAIASPEIQLKRMPSGRVDLPGVKDSETPEERSPRVSKEKQKPALSIDLARISNGRLLFSDLSNTRAFSTTVSDLDLSLNNFAVHDDRTATLSANANTVSGETLSVTGDLTMLPMKMVLRLDAKQLNIPLYTPYYQDLMGFRITDGRIDLTGKATIAENNDTTEIAFSNVAMQAKEFKMTEPDLTTHILDFENLALTGELDLTEKSAAVDTFSLKNGSLDARRDKDGKTNLEKAFLPLKANASKPADAPRETDKKNQRWQFAINTAQVKSYTIRATDRIPGNPAEWVLENLDFSAKDLSNRMNEKGTATLSFACNKNGNLSLNGDIILNPLSADMNLKVNLLGINPVQPYLSEKTGLIIKDGYVNAEGTVRLSISDSIGPSLAYKGQMSLNRFSSMDRAKADDFLKWDSLFITGINLQSNPLSAEIKDVSLSDFYARVVIDKDGTVNLATVLSGDEKPKTAPAPGNKKIPAVTNTPATENSASSSDLVKIDRVTLQGGEINLTDRLVPQGFNADIIDIGGRISGLASIKEKKANLFLKGRLGNHAPVEITGKINPLIDQMFADVKLTFSDIELSPFSPYSGQYVGYVLEKGKLTFDLEYLLENNLLKGKNRLYINQLTMGESVDSPDAVSLPVKLAIALLKDRSGNIELDLPVEGRMDDPEFKIGKVVLTVLKNLIVKIVSSPFAALGAMIGGGEELSYLDFDAAVSDLNTEGEQKLDKLVTILYERPNLNLEIKGGFDPEKDREALRSIQYENLLKAEKLKTIVKSQGIDISIDEVIIEPEERETWILSAYETATFPKPRDESGNIKTLSVQEMDKLLRTSILVTDDALRLLAHKRAGHAKDYMLNSQKVEPERIFILEPDTDSKKEERKSRVVFSLK